MTEIVKQNMHYMMATTAYAVVFPVTFFSLMSSQYCLQLGANGADSSLISLIRKERASSETCIISDHQRYYEVPRTTENADLYWKELKDDRKHHELSNSTGLAVQIDLNFSFPFYGHATSQVYLSTAGIISMTSDQSESPVSHYISPFLGHFIPNLSEDSGVYFETRESIFVVEWRNMYLRGPNDTLSIGPFQFQTIINKNGTLYFLYKKVPRFALIYENISFIGAQSGININIIKDAKTYIEYQGVDTHVSNNIVVISPKTMCELAYNSKTCRANNTLFYCKDCEIKQPCSYEIQRDTTRWLEENCKHEIPENCQENANNSRPLTVTIVFAVFAILILILLAVLGGWFYYAYTRPASPSGRWLIAHRPSQWIGLLRNRVGSTKDDTVSTTSQDAENEPGY